MAEVVVICGSSGFVSQHLISFLQTKDQSFCSEIRTIDKKPFCKFLGLLTADYLEKIPVRHYSYDLCDESKELSKVFSGCTTVFYCAGKRYEYLHSKDNLAHEFWHDNVTACQQLVRNIIENNVKRLVFVSDAYGNLPNCDNYGLSEQMHLEIPKSYMLGVFGETKTRGELIVREAAEKGAVNALFLRPTILYGEGETQLLESLLKHAKSSGGYPNICGDDRGNHQYIYAGNLAAAMFRSMEALREEPQKYNGEVIYCMDDTVCTPFKTFIKPFMEEFGMQGGPEVSYPRAYLTSVYNEALYKLGLLQPEMKLSYAAQRFLYGWTVGFSNRKLRLLLDFIPPMKQSEALKKTLLWYRQNRFLRSRWEAI